MMGNERNIFKNNLNLNFQKKFDINLIENSKHKIRKLCPRMYKTYKKDFTYFLRNQQVLNSK